MSESPQNYVENPPMSHYIKIYHHVMLWHHQNNVIYLVKYIKLSTDNLNNRFDKPYLFVTPQQPKTENKI